MKQGYVYIMASESGVLYIGITSNIEKRIQEHKLGIRDGFTKKYNVKKLVYYEESPSVEGAIEREKQLKKWSRKKKECLIEKMNPSWEDISGEFLQE